jgi:hypothetical protein
VISSYFATAMDCAGSPGGARAAKWALKGGLGAFNEAAGLAGGYKFSYPFL